jgi:hypothetical protein
MGRDNGRCGATPRANSCPALAPGTTVRRPPTLPPRAHFHPCGLALPRGNSCRIALHSRSAGGARRADKLQRCGATWYGTCATQPCTLAASSAHLGRPPLEIRCDDVAERVMHHPIPIGRGRDPEQWIWDVPGISLWILDVYGVPIRRELAERSRGPLVIFWQRQAAIKHRARGTYR